MTSAKSNSWLANHALTIVLAILAAQQAWNSFNTNLTTEIAVLKERVSTLSAQRCGR